MTQSFVFGLIIGALTAAVMLGSIVIDVTRYAYRHGAIDQASGKIRYVAKITAVSDTVWVRVIAPCEGNTP